MKLTDNKFETADRICKDIKKLCKTVGSRNAGSDGEKQTAEFFADRLSASADSVSIEKFKVNPNAFSNWIILSVSGALLGCVAYFFSSLVAILLFAVAMIPFIGQYILYKRMLDPLYAEKTSQNVTAIKSCSGEPKKRIYLVANTDACFEDTLKYRFGGVMLECALSFDVIGVLYFLALSIARWVFVGGLGASIASGPMLYAGLAGLVFVIPFFASYFTVNNKVVTDGANCNLTGCFVATEVLEAFKDVVFENTELAVLLTGSGVVGLRGAKAWCDAHAKDVDKDNTVFISLNALRELGSLNVNSSDMNGLVKSSKEVVNLVLESAKDIGVKCTSRRIPFDASDSVPFIQSGLKSAGICAIGRTLPDYYKTRFDSYDNLSSECIAECYGLLLEVVRRYADEGIEIEHTPHPDTEASDEPIEIATAVQDADVAPIDSAPII